MAQMLPASFRQQLAALQESAAASEEGEELFDEALRAANDAGWTYRQLGAALGVSHFYVSARIKRAPGTVSDFGFKIPARPSRTRVLEPRPLPETVLTDLRERLERAVSDRSDDRAGNGLTPAVAGYFHALGAALDAGWDPYEIAVPLGVNPRAVSRFATYHGNAEGGDSPEYPSPPERTGPIAWNARYPQAPSVTVPPEEAARLKELAEQAHMNRGVQDEDDGGALSSAVEYTTRVAGWYLRGASRQELESATGQGWEALRKRLSRWGYMSPPKAG